MVPNAVIATQLKVADLAVILVPVNSSKNTTKKVPALLWDQLATVGEVLTVQLTENEEVVSKEIILKILSDYHTVISTSSCTPKSK